MSDFQIVTIANRWPAEDYYCYKELFQSVGDNEILVLGTGEMEYTGLSDKPRIVYNAIQDGRINAKYIIFVDAFDVVFVDSPETIIEKFKSFGTKILIGVEKNCFPGNFQKEYDRLPHTSSYKYLNSGVIVAETEALLTVLEAMDAPNLPRDYHDSIKGYNHHFNDQAYYMDLFLRQPVPMTLDYNCEVAQNMQDVTMNDIELMGGLSQIPKESEMSLWIKNKETGKYPSIIHWNGGSKSGGTMQPILKHLNLL